MGAFTDIEWSDSSLNFWWGCTKDSGGCKHCYAETMSKRFGHDAWGPKGPRREINWEGVLREIKKRVAQGHRSKNGTHRLMVFVNDMSDFFEGDDTMPEISRAMVHARREQAFKVFEDNPDLIFQLLTKRPQNVMEMVPAHWRSGFPENVWLGTSCEDKETANRRIPPLLQCPASLLFLSLEPQIRGIKLRYIAPKPWNGGDGSEGEEWFDVLQGIGEMEDECGHGQYDLERRIGWVIQGFESGVHARPGHYGWACDVRDDCLATFTPYFFKQWGEWQDGSAPTQENITVLSSGSYGSGDPKTWAKDWEISDWPLLGARTMSRAGKKASGRELDDRTWSQFPEVPRVH